MSKATPKTKRRKREWTETDTGELSISEYLDGMKDEVSKHCIKAGKQTYRCKKNRSLGCKFGMRSYVDKKTGKEILEQAGEHMHVKKKISNERFTPGPSFLSAEKKEALSETAKKITAYGKGITACDESAGTIGKRFEAVGIENTEENRRLYRQMLFTTNGCEQYLSAAILDPETLYQKSNEGVLFPELLTNRGIVPGVKPHLKVYEIPGTNGDTVMQGLDSLAVRAKEYYKAGARFAKWRSPLVINIRKGCPTTLAIKSNMNDLARYALICQSEGLMPIVEPDVSLAGSHTLEEAVEINIKVQSELFKAMIDHGVYLPGTTLKPNIINPGKDCSIGYTVQVIAQANIHVLSQSFPVAMPGANFLSGGQSLTQAAARLSAMNKIKGKCPWNLSFSWSQALQLPLLELCKEKGGVLQIEEMGKLYVEELKIASDAAKGEYDWHDGDGDHQAK